MALAPQQQLAPLAPEALKKKPVESGNSEIPILNFIVRVLFSFLSTSFLLK